jgi:thioredoxin reductase/MFS family permease
MITFAHRRAFWSGIVAVSIGVLLHLPMYLGAGDMGYRLAGMPMDPSMKAGMALIVVGIALSVYGLVPRGAGAYPDRVAGVRVAALDDAPIQRAHLALLAVMAVAVTIDVMKPTTLAFVVPGVAQEYGLKSPLNPQGQVPVALLPLCALVGMVLGSVGWGWLGDRIGRRASILLAGVMFIATSICGAMPAFGWNLVMCFLMGAAVGGMLPITFALLAETIPARHRSWLMVLIGGDVAGAYIVTSLLASALEPRFGWRVLWLIGLPTGVLLILLNRWIPESPRFLLATGRAAEAEAVMARFGARLVPEEPAPRSDAEPGRYLQLFRRPFGGLTTAVVLFGLGWGLVNSGFLLWLPTNLRQLGLETGASERLLAGAAVIGFPAVFAVALLYGFWSSRGTMIGVALLTSATLFAFVALGRRVGDHPYVLQALIVLLLVGTNSILAVLTPYSSEVYPTRVRARGTGLAGACARAGGLLGVSVVVIGLAPPSLTGAATLGAIPTALAALAVAYYGVETRRRRLEEITATELAAGASPDTPGTTSEGRAMDCLVIGAGPAGLQLGYFLERAGRDYLILEAGPAPGTFFSRFPRHRRLISINKPHTGWDDPELNLRMDWNSLLSDDPSLRFTRYSGRYLPDADDLVRYLADFAGAFRLRVRYGTRVVRVSHQDGAFRATDESGRVYAARRLVVATGFSGPYLPPIPGIETAELYGTVSVDPGDFVDQRVLVIGKGNSGFETADNLIETAAVIHVAGPESIRMAWRTHYVGHLRAVNNNLLDTYQLKSQNALLDGTIQRIERRNGSYLVTVSFARADEVTKDIPYDRVIVCTGFRFDASIFDPACRPELVIDDRFPAQTPEWESVNVPGLYFAGTLMQVRDFKRSTGGFIHGFRYGVRALHRMLERKYHGVEWPHQLLPADPRALADAVTTRVNRTSALWQQFGFLCDLITLGPDGTARHYEELPVDYVLANHTGDYFTVTLEYGPDHDRFDPFDISVGRIAQSDAEAAAKGRYLHPVVRAYRLGELVAEHHVTENLENEWTDETVHREPLQAFLAREIGRVPV